MHASNELEDWLLKVEKSWWPIWLPLLGQSRGQAVNDLYEHLLGNDSNMTEENFERLLKIMDSHFDEKKTYTLLYWLTQNQKQDGTKSSLLLKLLQINKNLRKRNHSKIKNAFKKLTLDSLNKVIANIRKDGHKPVSDIEIIRSFVSRKIDIINFKDHDGSTLLHKIIATMSFSDEKENRELFLYLKENGADFNAKDNNGNTPLHYAAKHQLDTATIELLINEFGCAPERVNNAGDNAADLAYSADSPSRSLFALNKGESKLHAAIEKRDVEAFSARLAQTPPLNELVQERGNVTPLKRIHQLIKENNQFSNPRRWWKNRALKTMQRLYTKHIQTDSHTLAVESAYAKSTNKNLPEPEIRRALEELSPTAKDYINTSASAWDPTPEDLAEEFGPPAPYTPPKNNSPRWERQLQNPSSTTLSKTTKDSPRNNPEGTKGNSEPPKSGDQTNKPGR